MCIRDRWYISKTIPQTQILHNYVTVRKYRVIILNCILNHWVSRSVENIKKRVQEVINFRINVLPNRERLLYYKLICWTLPFSNSHNSTKILLICTKRHTDYNCCKNNVCCGGRQLTTFNRQARVLVGAARDKFGKLTRPFHGIIAGLSLSVYFKLRSTTLLILPRYSVQLQYVVSRSCLLYTSPSPRD